MQKTEVTICIVTHNSETDIEECLETLCAPRLNGVEVLVVDCDSSDRSCEKAARTMAAMKAGRLIELPENRGFAGGMNHAIAESASPFVMTLNPDARASPRFVGALLRAFRADPQARIGAVTGRLLRPGSEKSPILDAAGMRLSLTWRHFDRGSGLSDRGRFPGAARVFGGTGAATMFSREALEDTAIDGEYFLSEFHSFREDAELCFRLNERGWAVLYEPTATATHRRSNLPGRRRLMSDQVNYHSLKNRFLLRAYHQTWATRLVTLAPTLVRDLGILFYVLASERNSLRAFVWLWQNRRRIATRRSAIQTRRTVPAREIASWFLRSDRPI